MITDLPSLPNNLLETLIGLKNHNLTIIRSNGETVDNMSFFVKGEQTLVSASAIFGEGSGFEFKAHNIIKSSRTNRWLIGVYRLFENTGDVLHKMVPLVDLLKWNNIDVDQAMEIIRKTIK